MNTYINIQNLMNKYKYLNLLNMKKIDTAIIQFASR
jgi:hypothetical protein